MRTRALVLALGCMMARAEIVDRIAAVVGREVIAESRVEDQIRLNAVIDGTAPDLSLENRRHTLERLIEQILIRREVEFTRFPEPTGAEVQPLLKQVSARYTGGLREALARAGFTESDLFKQLRWQLTMLRFVEYRFQPAVQVSETQIRQEYRKQMVQWRDKNVGEPPTLDQIRPEIEKIIRQHLIDSALDRWLGEVRTQNTILYMGDYR